MQSELAVVIKMGATVKCSYGGYAKISVEVEVSSS